MRQFHNVARVSVAAMFLVSLSGVTSAQSPSPAATSLVGTDWNLVSSDLNGTQAPVPAGIAATLHIDGDLAAGSSGCNRYLAPVTISDTGLTFGEAMTTKKACPPPQMAFEQQFLATLATVASYSIDGDTLTLSNDCGRARPGVPGRACRDHRRVMGGHQYNNGRQATETSARGCRAHRRLRSRWTRSSAAEAVTASAAPTATPTRPSPSVPCCRHVMSCGDTTDAIESQYIAALQNATQVWTITEWRRSSCATMQARCRPRSCARRLRPQKPARTPDQDPRPLVGGPVLSGTWSLAIAPRRAVRRASRSSAIDSQVPQVVDGERGSSPVNAASMSAAGCGSSAGAGRRKRLARYADRTPMSATPHPEHDYCRRSVRRRVMGYLSP